MLKGFTAPRSPLGTAALVPSPPWHFAGDVLAVEFWNDPDVSAHILPTGVELDKKCPGHSVALFTDYQFTAENDEYLDPARYQCRGFSVLLDAIWKGTRIAWRPYCYVDNDAACYSAWGPNADRHHKSLIDLPSVGSMLGADSHSGPPRLWEDFMCRAVRPIVRAIPERTFVLNAGKGSPGNECSDHSDNSGATKDYHRATDAHLRPDKP